MIFQLLSSELVPGHVPVEVQARGTLLKPCNTDTSALPGCLLQPSLSIPRYQGCKSQAQNSCQAKKELKKRRKRKTPNPITVTLVVDHFFFFPLQIKITKVFFIDKEFLTSAPLRFLFCFLWIGRVINKPKWVHCVISGKRHRMQNTVCRSKTGPFQHLKLQPVFPVPPPFSLWVSQEHCEPV